MVTGSSTSYPMLSNLILEQKKPRQSVTITSVFHYMFAIIFIIRRWCVWLRFRYSQSAEMKRCEKATSFRRSLQAIFVFLPSAQQQLQQDQTHTPPHMRRQWCAKRSHIFIPSGTIYIGYCQEVVCGVCTSFIPFHRGNNNSQRSTNIEKYISFLPLLFIYCAFTVCLCADDTTIATYNASYTANKMKKKKMTQSARNKHEQNFRTSTLFFFHICNGSQDPGSFALSAVQRFKQRFGTFDTGMNSKTCCLCCDEFSFWGAQQRRYHDGGGGGVEVSISQVKCRKTSTRNTTLLKKKTRSECKKKKKIQQWENRDVCVKCHCALGACNARPTNRDINGLAKSV